MPVNRLCLGIAAGCMLSAASASSAQTACDADLDRDGLVSGADLALVLGDWGFCKNCAGDITGDGAVDGVDLAIVLSRWGGECTVPEWATLVEFYPDPDVIYDEDLRASITATGLPWRVRDAATGIEMLLVPPGSFEMGCSASNAGYCEPQELPVRTVEITQAFYLARYELTQAVWTSVAGSNPSFFQGINFPSPETRPVENVSWNSIQGFLAATSMRLPTEAEWEYAYRAGTQTAYHGTRDFPAGTNDDLLAPSLGWWGGLCCAGNGGRSPRLVGGLLANGFGLHDMAGNIWELVSDVYDANYYANGDAVDPQGPSEGTLRIARGGGYATALTEMRSSKRRSKQPNEMNGDLGFRVARNP